MKPANDNVQAVAQAASSRERGNRLFVWIGGAVALASLLAGLYVIEPPWLVRKMRLDEQRVGDLRGLGDAVDRYFRAKGALPASLDDLKASPDFNTFRPLADPMTGAAYEYTPGEGRNYNVCGTFDLENKSERSPVWEPNWAHAAGRVCFKKTVPAPPTTPSSTDDIIIVPPGRILIDF